MKKRILPWGKWTRTSGRAEITRELEGEKVYRGKGTGLKIESADPGE